MRRTRIRLAAFLVTCALFASAWVGVAALGSRAAPTSTATAPAKPSDTTSFQSEGDIYVAPAPPAVSTSQS